MIAIAIDRYQDGLIDIIVDENMAVDKKFNLVEKLAKILYEHHHTKSTLQNLTDLGAQVTMLLQEALSYGYLHTDLMFDFLENKPGYDILRASEDFNNPDSPKHA